MKTNSIYEYIRDNFSEKRRIHTEGVRQTAAALARKYGADPEKAETAALFHDMFRGRTKAEINELVTENGLPEKYRNDPNLAHGKIAAAVMQRDFGITDREILDAVSFHTTGRPAMTLLDKVVYIADAIEPSRDYPGVDRLRELAQHDLDAACLESMQGTIEHVMKEGGRLDGDTAAARDYLIKKRRKDR